jgi:hypothetical protein
MRPRDVPRNRRACDVCAARENARERSQWRGFLIALFGLVTGAWIVAAAVVMEVGS